MGAYESDGLASNPGWRITTGFKEVTSEVDTTPPTVALSNPNNGSTVSGTIPVSASASDNVGVAGVQFTLDSGPLGNEDTSSPYSVSWDTTKVSNGLHTLSATARDAAGNTSSASPVSVTVSNTSSDTIPPSVSITAPASGAIVSRTITVSASASDNVGVVGVRFKVDDVDLKEDFTAPYSATLNTSKLVNGSHTLTAIARDAAGNTTTSPPVLITVIRR